MNPYLQEVTEYPESCSPIGYHTRTQPRDKPAIGIKGSGASGKAGTVERDREGPNPIQFSPLCSESSECSLSTETTLPVELQ